MINAQNIEPGSFGKKNGSGILISFPFSLNDYLPVCYIVIYELVESPIISCLILRADLFLYRDKFIGTFVVSIICTRC